MRGKLTAVNGFCCLFLLLVISSMALPQVSVRPVASPPAQAQSPQRAHTVLKDVLARREFQQYRPRIIAKASAKKPTTSNWFQRWLRRLWRPIQRLWARVVSHRQVGDGTSRASAIMLLLLRFLIYAAVAAAVLFGLGLLVKSFLLRQRLRDSDASPDTATTQARTHRRRSPEPTAWDRSLHEAEAYWAQGDEREALRVLYRACLVLLDARGVLRYDESRANGEVLRELHRQGHSNVHRALTPIIRVFDRSWYGFLHVSSEEFSTAMRQSQEFRDIVIGGLHG